MSNRVRVTIVAEFETRDETAAKAVIQRIPSELSARIEHGQMGHAYTGVSQGSVQVRVVESVIE